MSTVTCSTCGTQSAAGAKFCAECGSPLPRVCSTCGHQVTANQKFCAECGSPLTGAPFAALPGTSSAPGISLPVVSAPATPPPPTQERRLVTILFADLVGSTSLGESLDPEDVYDLEEQVQGRMEESIRRYNGHVAKRLGDGIMALFGAPTAHEDDAERAVLAGLDMQHALKALNADRRDDVPPLQIRVGITSGEVIAGDLAGTYDVIGDAANVAARLQGAAEVGGVLVGEETMRLARRRVRFGGRQDLSLKGKAEPVAAYATLGVREQLGERWEGAGHAAPLVGRGRELETIRTAWERVQTGNGQILTIVGEPGVGKSRLVAEGIARIAADAAGPYSLLRGRCLSYGQSISLWLVADLLRSLCALSEGAGQETVGRQITATVEEILAGRDQTDRGIARDVLGEVLGLSPGDSLVAQAGPQIRRSSLIRTLGLILGALSETDPVLLVLEDLHWIDTASQEILEALLPDVPNLTVLILATQRPEWSAPWSSWSWTERLTLLPLPNDQATELAEAVLGGARLSSELEAHLRERAEGNPFFVEELARYLQETGGLERQEGEVRLLPGAAERLPATLTEVLLARLDRLESQVKRVAQVGSVIGRSFAVQLLSRVMEREEAALNGSLQALQQAQIANPRGGSDLEYVFKHVTVRDVAYSMLVRRRQRQLHLATARAIARLYPADEYVEMIAYHYARTNQDAEAAEWLERAGDRARDSYANEAAIEHYQAALARLERSGADDLKRAGIDERLGDVLFFQSRYGEAQAVLERAIERYRRAGDVEGMGRTMARLGRVLDWRGEPAKGRQQLEGMATLLEGYRPSDASVQVQLYLAHAFSWTGQYGEMLEAAERAGEMARALGDDGLRGRAEHVRGPALTLLGRMEEGREALEEAIHLLERAGDLAALITALGNLGENRRLVGQPAEAVELFERTVELGARTGNVASEILGHIHLTLVLLTIGEWGRAREHLARAVVIGRTREIANWVAPFFPHCAGMLALREGDWEEAAEQLHRATELAARDNQEVLEEAQAALAQLEILQGNPREARNRLEELITEESVDLPLVLPVLAWAHLELDETERGLDLAKQAEQEMRKRQALFYLPEALRIKGIALRRLGRSEEAGTALTEGRAQAAAMPNPYIEARILVELGLLDQQDGKTDQARVQLQEALTIFQRLGAAKDIERSQHALAELDRSAQLTQ